MDEHKYSLIDFPKSRIGTIDLGRIGRTKHHIAALLEIDVTDARTRLRTLRRESKIAISFTSWLVKIISTAITEHKEVHALLHRNRRKLIVFDDIDVALVVEKEVDGKLVPLPLLMKSANRKTMAQIQQEITNAKVQTVRNEGDYVLDDKRTALQMKLYYLLPQVLRLLTLKFMLSRPLLRKKTMGTVVITSIGTKRGFPGWFIHKSYHNLSFGVGSVVKKPWVIDDEIRVREILNLTILIDHDVIDGAPMARFVSRLLHLMETASGLQQSAPFA
jgi:pyruvate/2-oxoglutarate dehydrogenase complex dihydrolipoamide acyltransferase (E2) component